MDLATLNIDNYDRFERFLLNIRDPEYPYERFVTMTLRLPREVAIDHLRRATYHDDLNVAAEAVDLLSRLSPAHGAPRCFEFLDHADPMMRQIAVELLALTRTPCEDRVGRLLAAEPHGDVRYACARLLGIVGTRRSLPLVRRLASEDVTTDYEGRPTRNRAQEAVEQIIARAQW